LLASFIKNWEGQRVSIGGLFGAPVGSHEQVLPWSRHEQAAFLIFVGEKFKSAIDKSQAPWAKALRTGKQTDLFDPDDDLAFWGRHTLISQDQGIRGLLHIANDLCYLASDKLHLDQWGDSGNSSGTDAELVSKALKELKSEPVAQFLTKLGTELAKFDWRASSAPGLTEEQSLMKAAFRGSGGYRDFRRQLLIHLSKGDAEISPLAKTAIKKLGYE
jgi:hypothetical protein